MPGDFKERLDKLEGRFDDYMAMFYRWLDELRVDHEVSKQKIEQNERAMEEYRKRSDVHFKQNELHTRQNEQRINQNELQIAQLTEMQASMMDTQSSVAGAMLKISESHDRLMETQGMTIKILRGMEAKFSDHEGRLAAGGL